MEKTAEEIIKNILIVTDKCWNHNLSRDQAEQEIRNLLFPVLPLPSVSGAMSDWDIEEMAEHTENCYRSTINEEWFSVPSYKKGGFDVRDRMISLLAEKDNKIQWWVEQFNFNEKKHKEELAEKDTIIKDLNHTIECCEWDIKNRYTSEINSLKDRLADKEKEVEKLKDFKDYVHSRLDEANIEKNPNGEHSKHGCRIGDRLDIVLSLQSELEKEKIRSGALDEQILVLIKGIGEYKSELEALKTENLELIKRAGLELGQKLSLEGQLERLKPETEKIAKKFAEWTNLLQQKNSRWFEEHNVVFAESTDNLFEKFTKTDWYKQNQK